MDVERINKLRRIIAPLAHKEGAQVALPLPVWDKTGLLIGVGLSKNIKIGDVEHQIEATFSLEPADYSNDDRVAEKASAAAGAIRHSIVSVVRLKKWG